MEFAGVRSRKNTKSAFIQNKICFLFIFHSLYTDAAQSEQRSLQYEFMFQQLGSWHINKTQFPMCARLHSPLYSIHSFQKKWGG